MRYTKKDLSAENLMYKMTLVINFIYLVRTV